MGRRLKNKKSAVNYYLKFGNMSKVGKKPIVIPKGVEVKRTDGVLEFKGKETVLVLNLLPDVEAKIEGDTLLITVTGNTLQSRANWGTMRSLAQNAVIGVSEGFKKVLELRGVGFRANLEGSVLVLNVGFSHTVRFEPPASVKIAIEKNNIVTVSGVDKALVGQAAAKIRSIKKPNPYRGTGIRYKDEVVKIKAGKKVAGATGAA